MNSDLALYPVRVAAHPVVRILAAFPIACFSAALATDIAYAASTNIMWADFSAWLLAGGMAFGVLAAIGGLIDAIRNRHARARGPVATIALGGLVVLALALLNNLVHSRDAWTSVVPLGLVLSAATVAIMLITAWRSSNAIYLRATDLQFAGARA